MAAMSRRLACRLLASAIAAGLALPAAPAGAANRARLVVTGRAALEGQQGLAVLVDGRDGPGQQAFVVDDSPAAERRYRAEFLLALDALAMARGDAFILFEGLGPGRAGGALAPAWRLRLERPGRGRALRLVAEAHGGDRRVRRSAPLAVAARGPQRVQVEWRAGNGDGLLRVSLLAPGRRSVQVSAIRNPGQRLERVRLGLVSGLDAGTRGRLHLDAFRSFRPPER